LPGELFVISGLKEVGDSSDLPAQSHDRRLFVKDRIAADPLIIDFCLF
jgi:hypothetical protein